MKLVQTIGLASIAVIALLSGCKRDGNTFDPGTGGVTYKPDDYPAVDNSKPTRTITWSSSAIKLSHNVPYAEYGRIHRVIGDTLLLTYHCGDLANYWDNIAIRRSIDNGKTWSNAEIIVPDNNPAYYGFANPEILVLKNGDVLLAYTGRGNPDDNLHNNTQVRISKDRGWTFGSATIIPTGRSWEPGMVQWPDGEIHLFYSSEATWWGSVPNDKVNQDIRMTRSIDNGRTWGSLNTVAYTTNMRDGMPVPLILKDNKGVVFAIESVRNNKSPWIVWSSTEARWNYASFGTIANSRRWLATQENVWGGAPYLLQLSTGETLLSCQATGGRNIGPDWKKSTMVVLMGNSHAQNFTQQALPWPNLPTNEGAYYSSLFMKDANTVVLVTTRNFADNHSEIYWKEGTLSN